MKKYQDDYNYHDWSSFMVRESKEQPKGPHFGAVMFGTRNEYTPAYDFHDSGSSHSVPEITYFAFPDKETLREWALRALKDKKKFFFFEVKKIGDAQLNVSVDLDT